MSWAFRRRLIILSTIGAFLALFVAFPIALVTYDPPSCTDGKMNQKENGVDCGGPCIKQCTDLVSPVEVLWAKAFQSRPGVYYAIAFIENPNPDSGSRRIPYTFRFLDASGEVIAERTGETYLLPNERFPVFVGNVTAGDRIPSRVEVRFSRAVEWLRMDTPAPTLSVTERDLRFSDTRPRLTANLTNGGASTVRDVGVTAVISDKQGAPVGGSSTYIDAVGPGETARLTFTWSEPFAYDAETEACTQPVDVILALDRSGSMASESKVPPQPLTQAKEAAAIFVERMTAQDQVGYVSFATEASNPIDQELTRNMARVTERILSTEISAGEVQYTNIGDALARARIELQTQRRNQGARPVLILLTDGAPTYPKDANDPDFPAKYALQVANILKADGVNVFTIGLGEDLNENLLLDIASSPTNYYKAVSGAELAEVYRRIAGAVCLKAPPLVEIFPRVNNVP